ncbi:MAG: IMP dehydrogenase [Candidatus Yanofskybacteria bacterium]|nr:IMP dehydrogenase [Candidatus Yanofskybacteria bacterium]
MQFGVEDIFVGKTFDDFSIEPQLGVVEHRKNVQLKTKFSKNIELNLPLVAANMDTVTGPKMCIALAQHGGIGILPRSGAISIKLQTEWTREVKRAENFIIRDPYTISENQSVSEARRNMKEKGVGTLLVVGEKKELIGMVTERDTILCLNEAEPITDWMQKVTNGNLRFTKNTVLSIEEAASELRKHGVSKLPIIDGLTFKILGLITAKDIARLLKHKWANKDKEGRLRVGAAIGATGDYIERASELIKAGVDVIVMDMAHAHNKAVTVKAIESFRKSFENFELVCGNVATFEGAEFLKDLGVQGVKVGIGSGHGCLTRIKTGVGVPQVQAVRAAWHALKDFDIPIISDGGVRQTGHISMALAVGASSVMVGSVLAGTDEALGQFIQDPLTGAGKKEYRGMTSPQAKLEASGSKDPPSNVEGKSENVPYRGSVVGILKAIQQDLQSMVSYCGENDLEKVRLKLAREPLKFLIPLSVAAAQESYHR